MSSPVDVHPEGQPHSDADPATQSAAPAAAAAAASGAQYANPSGNNQQQTQQPPQQPQPQPQQKQSNQQHDAFVCHCPPSTLMADPKVALDYDNTVDEKFQFTLNGPLREPKLMAFERRIKQSVQCLIPDRYLHDLRNDVRDGNDSMEVHVMLRRINAHSADVQTSEVVKQKFRDRSWFTKGSGDQWPESIWHDAELRVHDLDTVYQNITDFTSADRSKGIKDRYVDQLTDVFWDMSKQFNNSWTRPDLEKLAREASKRTHGATLVRLIQEQPLAGENTRLFVLRIQRHLTHNWRSNVIRFTVNGPIWTLGYSFVSMQARLWQDMVILPEFVDDCQTYLNAPDCKKYGWKLVAAEGCHRLQRYIDDPVPSSEKDPIDNIIRQQREKLGRPTLDDPDTTKQKHQEFLHHQQKLRDLEAKHNEQQEAAIKKHNQEMQNLRNKSADLTRELQAAQQAFEKIEAETNLKKQQVEAARLRKEKELADLKMEEQKNRSRGHAVTSSAHRDPPPTVSKHNQIWQSGPLNGDGVAPAKMNNSGGSKTPHPNQQHQQQSQEGVPHTEPRQKKPKVSRKAHLEPIDRKSEFGDNGDRIPLSPYGSPFDKPKPTTTGSGSDSSSQGIEGKPSASLPSIHSRPRPAVAPVSVESPATPIRSSIKVEANSGGNMASPELNLHLNARYVLAGSEVTVTPYRADFSPSDSISASPHLQHGNLFANGSPVVPPSSVRHSETPSYKDSEPIIHGRGPYADRLLTPIDSSAAFIPPNVPNGIARAGARPNMPMTSMFVLMLISCMILSLIPFAQADSLFCSTLQVATHSTASAFSNQTMISYSRCCGPSNVTADFITTARNAGLTDAEISYMMSPFGISQHPELIALQQAGSLYTFCPGNSLSPAASARCCPRTYSQNENSAQLFTYSVGGQLPFSFSLPTNLTVVDRCVHTSQLWGCCSASECTNLLGPADQDYQWTCHAPLYVCVQELDCHLRTITLEWCLIVGLVIVLCCILDVIVYAFSVPNFFMLDFTCGAFGQSSKIVRISVLCLPNSVWKLVVVANIGFPIVSFFYLGLVGEESRCINEASSFNTNAPLNYNLFFCMLYVFALVLAVAYHYCSLAETRIYKDLWLRVYFATGFCGLVPFIVRVAILDFPQNSEVLRLILLLHQLYGFRWVPFAFFLLPCTVSASPCESPPTENRNKYCRYSDIYRFLDSEFWQCGVIYFVRDSTPSDITGYNRLMQGRAFDFGVIQKLEIQSDIHSVRKHAMEKDGFREVATQLRGKREFVTRKRGISHRCCGLPIRIYYMTRSQVHAKDNNSSKMNGDTFPLTNSTITRTNEYRPPPSKIRTYQPSPSSDDYALPNQVSQEYDSDDSESHVQEASQQIRLETPAPEQTPNGVQSTNGSDEASHTGDARTRRQALSDSSLLSASPRTTGKVKVNTPPPSHQEESVTSNPTSPFVGKLNVESVKGDGQCFFSCIETALDWEKGEAKSRIASLLESPDLPQIVTDLPASDYPNSLTLADPEARSKYIAELRGDTLRGGESEAHLLVHAVSEVRIIIIFFATNLKGNLKHCVKVYQTGQAKREIMLFWHKHGAHGIEGRADHYDLIVEEAADNKSIRCWSLNQSEASANADNPLLRWNAAFSTAHEWKLKSIAAKQGSSPKDKAVKNLVPFFEQAASGSPHAASNGAKGASAKVQPVQNQQPQLPAIADPSLRKSQLSPPSKVITEEDEESEATATQGPFAGIV